ncbi:MAG: VOC family protein [Kordiimonadaceae bacterium]|nr:VOC family protein [Kordiimonadaceae bacterium]MBO6567305.1 VOC family protein [Kordiimonadaceae bacterium]MBO6963481.1 VOC family protein [Kordiimonadaceae bacterium]
MKHLLGLILFSFVSLVPANAQRITEGYHELLIVTADASAWVNEFAPIAGWEVRGSGTVDAGWLSLWGVEQSASYTVIGNPGTERGFIRLIEFDGEASDYIRPNGQSWDTGGLFDFNMRVADMNATRRALMDAGWTGASEPIQFSFGPFVVKEWLPRGLDGVRLAVIERIQPPLEGWPNMKKFSRAFNATMIVSDIEDARRFWRDGMGFRSYLDHKAPSKTAGPNVLGLPHNLATEIVRDVSIMHPNGENEGSIELLAFEGASGSDFSGRTDMPNRGLARLRFPAEGLVEVREYIANLGYPVTDISNDLPMSGVGSVNVFVATAPGGTKIEIYEVTGD